METSQDDAETNLLLEGARIPGLVVTAAALLAVSGLFVLLVGLQNLMFVTWRGNFALIPYALLGIGVAGIYVAAKLHRARGWALAAGMGITVVILAATLAFFVVSVLSGMLSLLALLAVPLALATLIVEILAARSFSELVQVRTRLKKSGYDLDF